MRFEVVPGRKGPNDKLVKIWAYGEVLSFSDLLFLLKNYFESEDDYYPPDKGFKGRAMLMNAIVDVFSGISLSRVLKEYKLERKAKNTVIVEKMSSESPLEKVADFM